MQIEPIRFPIIYDTRHEKTDLVVLPKEWWGRVAPPSFFGYDTDFQRIWSMKSKDSNSEQSVSYEKKDGHGHARPFFFWYDNGKDLKVYFLVMHVISW